MLLNSQLIPKSECKIAQAALHTINFLLPNLFEDLKTVYQLI